MRPRAIPEYPVIGGKNGKYVSSSMKIFLLSLFFIPMLLNAQDRTYEANNRYPYGRMNPDAPRQTADFDQLIGENTCLSLVRNPDGTWQDTLKMIWTFKYIMNGHAVQDEVFSERNRYAGSIRQYNSDSSKWFVSYYSNASVSSLAFWTGIKESDGRIVLHRPQASPQGQPGDSRLTFYDIGLNGFNWIGEWVSENGTVIYPFWKIYCTRQSK